MCMRALSEAAARRHPVVVLAAHFRRTLITDGSNVVLYQIQQLPDSHPVFVGCEFLLCFQLHPRTTWLNMANQGDSEHVGENWS